LAPSEEREARLSIALTGFMGAGKTSTGRILARMLRMSFVDSDSEIERRHGPLQAIFEREGEARFRRYETEVLSELSAGVPKVIAVGGGGVIDAANRKLLRRFGYIVHLQISPEAAHARIAHRTHRPLLGERPDVETIRGLLESRREAYKDCDFTIATGRRSGATVAAAIARWYRGKLGRAANSGG